MILSVSIGVAIFGVVFSPGRNGEWVVGKVLLVGLK